MQKSVSEHEIEPLTLNVNSYHNVVIGNNAHPSVRAIPLKYYL